MSLIYEPAEDSYLIQEVLEKELLNKNINILEIGCGSGILLSALKKLGINNIFGADINRDAVKHCVSLGFNCIRSNLFSDIKEKYDLIIFNPPYLPEDKRGQEDRESMLATTGGKKGFEIINRFLKQAKNHLNQEGKIFLLTSSLTKNINWLDYKKKLMAKKKLFFEELYVWELKF